MEKLIDVPFTARRKMEQFTVADLDIQIRQKPTPLPKSGSNPDSDNGKNLLAISHDSVYNAVLPLILTTHGEHRCPT